MAGGMNNDWKAADYLHRNGWMELVTDRWPYVPDWVAGLWRRATRQRRRELDYGYRVNFAEMHRMYMRQLQAKLIDIAISVQFNKGELTDSGAAGCLEDALRKYVQAVQDQEYMAKFSHKAEDPFIATSERQHDDYLLRRAMLMKGKGVRDLEKHMPTAIRAGPWESSDSEAQPIGSTRGEFLRRALWLRIGAALLGGIFLVGPMWLLVLRRVIFFQLGFTTGCVLAFALLMAWYLNTAEAVFLAALAYTAVLMVFIGAMMQEQSR